MFASVSERAAKFQDLGGALGLKAGALETIRSDHDNAKDRLREVVKQWLFRENIIKSKESNSHSSGRSESTRSKGRGKLVLVPVAVPPLLKVSISRLHQLQQVAANQQRVLFPAPLPQTRSSPELIRRYTTLLCVMIYCNSHNL